MPTYDDLKKCKLINYKLSMKVHSKVIWAYTLTYFEIVNFCSDVLY